MRGSYMNIEVIKKKLKEVLEDIQEISELDCPPFNDKTIPVKELPQFDSKIWPVVTSLVADGLEIFIPNDINIFCNENNQDKFSIEQIAEKILAIHEKQLLDLPKKDVANQ